MESPLKVVLNNKDARAPTRGSPGAAGYDLFSIEDIIIAPGKRAVVKTGIILEIPEGVYGRVAPRSGLAFKYGLQVLAGVIDSDYRGEINVILHNSNDIGYGIRTGDRIAQIVFEKIWTPDINVVTSDDLSSTQRDGGGFGSTGVN